MAKTDFIDTNPEALRSVAAAVRNYVETQYEIIRDYLARMSSLAEEIETNGFQEYLERIRLVLSQMDGLKLTGLAFCTFLISKAIMLEEQSTNTSASASTSTGIPQYSSSSSRYYTPTSSASAYIPSHTMPTYTPTRTTAGGGPYSSSWPPRTTSAGVPVTTALSSHTIPRGTVVTGTRPPVSHSAITTTEKLGAKMASPTSVPSASVSKSSATRASGFSASASNVSSASKSVADTERRKEDGAVSPAEEKDRNRAQVTLNSKGFKRLMKLRGYDKPGPNGEEPREEQIRKSIQGKVYVRHGYEGDPYTLLSGKKRASGLYLAGRDAETRASKENVDAYALPPKNDASNIRKVELAKEQFILVGKVASQPEFTKDAKDGVERAGGATQYITHGGFEGGAVREIDQQRDADKDDPNHTVDGGEKE